ncbi:prolipoprotein diacylglyceryl transferase family protein [Aurantimonas coralicida]|uniref:prolipoprotein diacylglyceryl transferase family protein n=1 Tax=Aurantimonas coralicida TaxID=182270 RepID=UPI002388BEF6|nr:prolipoprotein diacylglyceryl transferase family protein [Aurantimonas coralicida]MDE0925319.1 prolipoprotein diacylglyceryl transferase [Aurantimonas coralicida]
MAALTLGPLVFAGDRLAAIMAIVVFLGVAAILAGRVDERLGNWSLTVVPIGIIAARLGHVVLHWETFAPEPFRVFSVWEGGFAGLAGLAVALLYTLYVFRDVRLRVWSIGALAGAFVAWSIAWQLVASTEARLPARALPCWTVRTAHWPISVRSRLSSTSGPPGAHHAAAKCR